VGESPPAAAWARTFVVSRAGADVERLPQPRSHRAILTAWVDKRISACCARPRLEAGTAPRSTSDCGRSTDGADAEIPELTTLAETIETRWPAIEVFLITGLTNARTVDTNRLIKQVQTAARGFRNRDNYRRRVRLRCTRQTHRCQRGTQRCQPKIEEPNYWWGYQAHSQEMLPRQGSLSRQLPRRQAQHLAGLLHGTRLISAAQQRRLSGRLYRSQRASPVVTPSAGQASCGSELI
jgi:hypothetical protein